jgi:hypothetical protein
MPLDPAAHVRSILPPLFLSLELSLNLSLSLSLSAGTPDEIENQPRGRRPWSRRASGDRSSTQYPAEDINSWDDEFGKVD